MSAENGKVCCNCRHNKRVVRDKRDECRCEIDDHFIGYIECFEGWCRRWAKERDND